MRPAHQIADFRMVLETLPCPPLFQMLQYILPTYWLIWFISAHSVYFSLGQFFSILVQLRMCLKPQAQKAGNEAHLGWQMDRHATVLLVCYRLGQHGFTLCHKSKMLGREGKGLARWTTWTNGQPISKAQIIYSKYWKK